MAVVRIKTQSQHSMVTMPKYAFEDANLTLAEKGLYATFFCENKSTFSADITSDEEVAAMKGLIQKGYVVKAKAGSSYQYKVNFKPTAIKDKVEPTIAEATEPTPVVAKKKTKQEIVDSLVDEYTSDEKLRQVLKAYFHARHKKVGRFAEMSLWYSTDEDARRMLNQLNTIPGDKYAIVKASLDGQFFKFFEQPESNVSTDGVSNRYSQEEIEEFRRKAAEIQQNGGMAY